MGKGLKRSSRNIPALKSPHYEFSCVRLQFQSQNSLLNVVLPILPNVSTVKCRRLTSLEAPSLIKHPHQIYQHCCLLGWQRSPNTCSFSGEEQNVLYGWWVCFQRGWVRKAQLFASPAGKSDLWQSYHRLIWIWSKRKSSSVCLYTVAAASIITNKYLAFS